MKEMIIRNDSIKGFLIKYAGFSNRDFDGGCNPMLDPEFFVIEKSKVIADSVIFLIEERTSITRSIVETEVLYKREMYDDLNNKYTKQK